MKYKGYDLRLRPDLAFRDAQKTDIDLDGKSFDRSGSYVVFTTVQRCLDKVGRMNPTKRRLAKPIPTVNTRTNLGLGKLRENNSRGMNFYNSTEEAISHPDHMDLIPPHTEYFVQLYWSRPVYAALDGKVYSGTVYYPTKPANLKKFDEEKFVWPLPKEKKK